MDLLSNNQQQLEENMMRQILTNISLIENRKPAFEEDKVTFH